MNRDQWKLTEVYWKNVSAAKTHRVIANKGGTSSSKTFSILQLLFTIASRSKKPLLISVVSETFPHLRKGAMTDFFKLINPVYNRVKHDKTNSTYHVGVSKIEFFSADQIAKVKGPRRDILYLNEANHIKWKAVEQLMVRTEWKIFMDWNPESEFYFEEHLEQREDCALIHSTYLDALNVIPPSIVKEIEIRKPVYAADGVTLISGDPHWWNVYALGITGTLEGLVYNHWEIVDAMPTDKEGKPIHKWIVTGLDWGFTNDPTACDEICFHDGAIWVNELIHEHGMTNPDISERLSDLSIPRSRLIIADSAEPKSITELQRLGWKVLGAKKGKDSIKQGISVVKQYPLKITKNSTNTIKEARSYKWLEKDGEYINVPQDRWNHHLDEIRYVVSMKMGGSGGRILASG